MSFRSSAPVRLRDQHPEAGSIPGSSTDGRPRFRDAIPSLGLLRPPPCGGLPAGGLGVGSRLVLVRYQDLNFANNKVTLNGATKDNLAALPEFKYAG